jgi:hypothetical protein
MSPAQSQGHTFTRYKKQRHYTPGTGVVIKFLPIPFAVIMANIVIRIKPIEAEFARIECRTEVVETCGVLYTLNGIAVDPTKMAQQLSDTFEEFGFKISIAPLRHALDAFAHKFYQRGTGWNGGLVEQANHSMGTSARYGRDDESFVGIPMDISEDNYFACNDWNTVILGSPSILSDDSRSTLFKQLEELDLLGAQSPTWSQLSQPTQSSKRLRLEGTASVVSKRVDQAVCIPAPGMSSADPLNMSPAAPCRMTPEVHPGVLRPIQSQALLFLGGLVDNAIIIMPTGSGKTQLILSHRRPDTCSVLFAPYNLLCRQLQSISEQKGTTVVWPFSTFKGSSDALVSTAEFAILPYEAAPLAHSFVAALHERGRLGPIWIDEVRNVLVYDAARLNNPVPGSHSRIQRQVQRVIR